MSGEAPGSGGLSDGQREALAEAGRRLVKIRRARRFATFNGWTVGAFGGLTILFGLTNPWLLVVGAALVAVAWNELQGRDLLRDLRPEGARRLGWNQVALLAVVAVYCVAAIARARAAPRPEVSQLEQLAGLPEGYVAELTTTAYVAVLVILGIFQGFMARFHFAREEMVETYLRETPGWVVEVQRASEG